MDSKYEASTVEMDKSGFAELKSQLLEKKTETPVSTDIRDANKEVKPTEEAPKNKKFLFKRGEESVELDDDYELEIMADKRPTKMTLRELKERASGDIAVKNRMHALAEEKKRVQSTFKEFAELSKKDPLGALEFISARAKEADGEFEYQKYIEKLADQAEKLGQMDEKDRKNLELEKKLEKAETDLSWKQREQAVALRKQQLQSEYPEIGDSQFSQMVEAVLGNEVLLEGVEDEKGVMDKVEELIQETLTQRDIMQVINEVNPAYINDNNLIFSLSDQLRQNPDLDEDDIRDIIKQVVAPQEKIKSPESLADAMRASKVLSSKARDGTPINQIREQNMSAYDLLKQQLLDKKVENSKTPLYKR
jgi:hypothetical protein